MRWFWKWGCHYYYISSAYNIVQSSTENSILTLTFTLVLWTRRTLFGTKEKERERVKKVHVFNIEKKYITFSIYFYNTSITWQYMALVCIWWFFNQPHSETHIVLHFYFHSKCQTLISFEHSFFIPFSHFDFLLLFICVINARLRFPRTNTHQKMLFDLRVMLKMLKFCVIFFPISRERCISDDLTRHIQQTYTFHLKSSEWITEYEKMIAMAERENESVKMNHVLFNYSRKLKRAAYLHDVRFANRSCS